jgi:hypothetical protein
MLNIFSNFASQKLNMNKKKYIAPEIRILEVKYSSPLLSNSYDIGKNTIKIDFDSAAEYNEEDGPAL